MHSLTHQGVTILFNSDLSGTARITCGDSEVHLPGELLQKLVDYIKAGNEDESLVIFPMLDQPEPMLPLYPGRSEPQGVQLSHMVNPCDCDLFPHYHEQTRACVEELLVR